MGLAVASLHIGDHRRPEGRCLPPPRRVFECARKRACVSARCRQRLSVDAADVPLQRLDVHVGRYGGGWHPCMPATRCAWQNDWDALPAALRAQRMARQGVAMPTLASLQVGDSETAAALPRDGSTLGEVMLRGNTIMKGYFKNAAATAAAFAGGWYRTGDLAVWHPDNYIEIKDRLKDIIITGGENVSSLEIEECLYRHPQIMEAA